MASNLSDLGFTIRQPQQKTGGSDLFDLGFASLGDTDLENGFFGKIAESFERGGLHQGHLDHCGNLG